MSTFSARRRAAPIAVALVAVLSLVLGLTACAATPVPSPVSYPAAPRHDMRFWQAEFDDAAAALDRDATELSRSTDSWDFYELAYAVDAFTSMYEATGDRSYADTALRYAENMIGTARPSSSLPGSRYQDDFLGWASEAQGEGGDEVPLYESYCWRYVTRLLAAMKARGLPADAGFGPRYERVLGFTETNIVDKWFARGPDDTVFRSRTHMTSHWAYIAVEMAQVTGRADRRARYLDTVGRINDAMPEYSSSLRAQMTPSPVDPSAWTWSSEWGDDSPQDVAHGNGDVAYIAEARTLGAGWNADDVGRLSRTLLLVVLGHGGEYPEYVDGSGSGTGWIADGFVKLGRFDPSVQAALEQHGVQNGQFYAAMAANAAMLDRERPAG